MRNKEEMDRTDNSTIYRRTRKLYLEVSKALIHCSYCKFHRGENRTNSYGGFIEKGVDLKDGNISYPSWKLASKNPKQWMFKNNVKMTISPPHYRRWDRKNINYVEFQIGKKRKSGIKYSSK